MDDRMLGTVSDIGDDLSPQRREQRLQSIRFVMMVLLILTLMDGEEVQRKNKLLNAKKEDSHAYRLQDFGTNTSREDQDRLIRAWLHEHPRYKRIVDRNEGVKPDRLIALTSDQGSLQKDAVNMIEQLDEDHELFFYPWNITGLYRGSWSEVSYSDVPFAKNISETATVSVRKTTTPVEMEGELSEVMMQRGVPFGFSLLDSKREFAGMNSSLRGILPSRRDRRQSSLRGEIHRGNEKTLSLTQSSGRATFQFYSRPIPDMREFSIVEGLVKIYDSNSIGYSTRRDVIIRVRGVLIHQVGTVSLFSTSSLSRSSLTIVGGKDGHSQITQNLTIAELPGSTAETDATKSNIHSEVIPANSKENISAFDVVYPYPFVRDDSNRTISQFLTPAGRRLPPREEMLEAKAAGCDFEIHLDVREERIKQKKKDVESPGTTHIDSNKMNRAGQIELDSGSIMILNGTLLSHKCLFAAKLNATAVRAEKRHSSTKATYYAFAMLLTCLMQIMLLLKQLLHTQAQGMATRVSVLCIGWQAILDALLCLLHVYLSLTTHDLFTSFASIAFFKLLIFCVIEMKYMVIVLQARGASRGETTPELMRRQVACLHLRFYISMVVAVAVLVCSWNSLATISLLLLYSFWVPQIVRGLVKDDRPPLHRAYVVGTSLTRLVAPMCIFWNDSEFLGDLYTGVSFVGVQYGAMFVWIGLQVLVLEGQRKFGPRFMVPRRFLPPKYNYNRPLPRSLVKMSAQARLATEKDSSDPDVFAVAPSPVVSSPKPTGTRNRIRGRVTRPEITMTAENLNSSTTGDNQALECVICCSEIDPQNHRGYMLAPCDHVFHKECLLNWMKIKMECPTCRKELPSV